LSKNSTGRLCHRVEKDQEYQNRRHQFKDYDGNAPTEFYEKNKVDTGNLFFRFETDKDRSLYGFKINYTFGNYFIN